MVRGLIVALVALPLLTDGYFPTYTTAGLPVCPGTETNRPVLDTTTGEIKRCNGTSWVVVGDGTGGGALETGLIVLSLGACPSGYAEETSLNGKFVLGTLNANGDVTTTGGADTITSVLNHTHPVTDPGHNHTQNSHTHVVTSQTATTGAATSYEHGTLDTSSAEAEATEVTGATTATNQSNTTGVTTANPAGGVASIDNRPAFVRVIFCKKT